MGEITTWAFREKITNLIYGCHCKLETYGNYGNIRTQSHKDTKEVQDKKTEYLVKNHIKDITAHYLQK